jgi:MFS family permease
VQVAVVAFAHLRHASGQSGLLISVWSLGSLIGGLSYGRRATASGAEGLGGLLVLVGVGEALLAGSPTVAVLYVILFLGGMGFAPVIGCLLHVVSDVVPSHSATEAFGWVASGNRAGAAAGAALGGLLVQATGTRMVFVLAGLATALAGVAAISGRTTLQPQHA